MIYPDGKLNKTDEGSLAVRFTIEHGRLVMDFGKDLSWIGFDKVSLRNFIDGLEVKYKEL